jgi:hypothetical protein
MHISDTTEHQRIKTVSLHAGEHLCAPLPAQAGEVHAGVVLEAHHPGKHTAVAGGGAHVPSLYGS